MRVERGQDRIEAGNAERLSANRALFDAFVAGRDDLESMTSAHGLTAQMTYRF